ncbi:MAG: hypothetical protein JO168_26400 [Solirubrobacterales bacterium]|nr:hypothetical protein [Solirubrobacterales bacterium]MBV9715696.1 hypothetical protein [Solirubrobacterales bacterium]
MRARKGERELSQVGLDLLHEAFHSIYRSPDETKRTGFLAAVDRAQIPSFAAFADGVSQSRSLRSTVAGREGGP